MIDAVLAFVDWLPSWGLSLLAGGPVGGAIGLFARNWKVAAVAALVLVAGVWIGVGQVRLANARAEIDRVKAEREAERADVAEVARKAAQAALVRALEIQERQRADSAVALRNAETARRALAVAREEIARDPDASTPVAAPVRRYLDRLRQRRPAGPDAGAGAGGPRDPDRPGAAGLRGRAAAAAGRERPRDLPDVGRGGPGRGPGLPLEARLHRAPAGGPAVPARGVAAAGVRF